ncbi:MAG: type II secretion system F family protein [Magnetospirillum sp.]|nr:type II secretion system F family protein [Magnetospirillum sp.]
MTILLRAGLTPAAALDAMAKLPDCARMRRVAADLCRRVRAGVPLADAMAAQGPVFRHSAIRMVGAGERAGALDVVTSRLAELGECKAMMRGGMALAMLYPVLMLLISMAATAVLLGVVRHRVQPLPQDAGANLSQVVHAALGVGGTGVLGGSLVLLAVFAGAAAAARRSAEPGFRLASMLPGIGRLLAENDAVRLLRGVEVLLATGVPARAALALLSHSARNVAIAQALRRGAAALGPTRGTGPPPAGQSWFSSRAARGMAMGEETGRLAEMARRADEAPDGGSRRAAAWALLLAVLGRHDLDARGSS